MQTPHPARTLHSRCKASASLLKNGGRRPPMATFSHKGRRKKGASGSAGNRAGATLNVPSRPSFLPRNPDIPLMSALFTPIKLRELKLQNRIMVAPMCQYSAQNGEANDWHFTHINNLALSGAAMFCIEATHVEATGRITPGCLGLYNDATEAALKPILASVRKHSKTAVAMQLAHAGRKAPAMCRGTAASRSRSARAAGRPKRLPRCRSRR